LLTKAKNDKADRMCARQGLTDKAIGDRIVRLSSSIKSNSPAALSIALVLGGLAQCVASVFNAKAFASKVNAEAVRMPALGGVKRKRDADA